MLGRQELLKESCARCSTQASLHVNSLRAAINASLSDNVCLLATFTTHRIAEGWRLVLLYISVSSCRKMPKIFASTAYCWHACAEGHVLTIRARAMSPFSCALVSERLSGDTLCARSP